MISKKGLLELYVGLLDDIKVLEEKVIGLEQELKKIKSCACGKNTDGIKRRPGRPRKNS